MSVESFTFDCPGPVDDRSHGKVVADVVVSNDERSVMRPNCPELSADGSCGLTQGKEVCFVKALNHGAEDVTTSRLGREPHAEVARREMAFAILNGELKKGEIYSGVDLANQLGVSQTPVREAMIVLGTMGLVEPLQSRGFQIREHPVNVSVKRLDPELHVGGSRARKP